MDSARPHLDWFSGSAAGATGFGVLTFAFFPFALPLLILTVAATLPIVLPLVVLAAVAAILRGTWRGTRAAGRRIHRLWAAGTARRGARRTRRPASGGASGLLPRRPQKGT
jgi:hypothetical protein